ncbi:MAG: RluA family pseudouridine synthase [Woeseiaceae bacterium]|nr:RluA family pseudouridine synthase [Woeseiaceae bacterium]NIP19642.1 RluA family pseudouridine synthase [Woeseiaceae bacterium]NIS89759.1 RluA family pseudouridine synthase [Woeseiaceae bacterium]
MQQKSEKGTGSAVTGVRKVRIDSEQAGQRIDNFLRRELPGLPKGRLYRILRRGEVRVNGGRIRAEYKLQEGDEVRIPPARVRAPGDAPAEGSANAMADRIIFEDKRLLVVDKPSGVAVHGGSGISHGVIELLRHARPELRDLSLVHRLDRETSGCLVLAKRRSALREMHERFREGDVEKHYLALVVGDWQLGEQLIDKPLLVENRKGGERHVVVSKGGKPAQTRVSLSRTFGKFSLLNCLPRTGRTHQLRVHLAAIGFPILGDDRYGDEDQNRLARKHGLKRLFLHAQSIAFPDDSGNELHFTAPLADDLQLFLDRGIDQIRSSKALKRG